MNDSSYKHTAPGNWKDTGCDLSPLCLQCHLSKCAEERHGGRQKIRLELRAKGMRKMRRAGHKIRDISIAFGVSIRTAQRVLRNNR